MLTKNQIKFAVYLHRTGICNHDLLGNDCSKCPVIYTGNDWCNVKSREEGLAKLFEEHHEEFLEALLEG